MPFAKVRVKNHFELTPWEWKDDDEEDVEEMTKRSILMRAL
jgi:hypothetical protein